MFQPYSGASSLAKALRIAAFGGGLLYGSVKLGYLKGIAAKNAKKAATEGAH